MGERQLDAVADSTKSTLKHAARDMGIMLCAGCDVELEGYDSCYCDECEAKIY
jgi:hypothetical protein